MSEARGDDAAEYLKDTEVAALLRFSVNTVRLWRTNGGGPPFVKIDDRGSVRYRRSDLDAWLAERVRFVTDGSKFIRNRAARASL